MMAASPVATAVLTDRGLAYSILVVDDDALFREFVATTLERAGYRAVEAATGEEALEVAVRELPRVVVLDVHLPGISGHEVCQKLRAAGDRTHVLFVSGERVEPYDRVAGLLVGGDDYLVKPFAPDELLARVHAMVRRAGEHTRTDLTSEDRELVELMRAGVGCGEIAERLGEPPNEVGRRLTELFRKLGV
jgi:two-component system, OmpR family, response regulator